MTRSNRFRRPARALALAAGLAALGATDARAQWVTTYEQFYLEAPYNWQFLENYPATAKLFNAFDFGHAILYETLWVKPNAPVSELEQKWYDRLTKRILVDPPRVPLEEAAIEIQYARLAPEAKAMFDWAHLLHRQIYDVWSDERIPVAEKDSKVEELIRYYKTRRDLAFSSRPKSMKLMQEQPYSLAFRQNYPKFNGLIWAYHWLQIGLYEPLIVGKDKDERQTGVLAAAARFRQMIEDAPSNMPHVMPMTAAVAPKFTERYPEAAIIFDNLHSMHDVVSDILANPSVPRNRKRAEIMLAARRFRDDTSYVMPVEAWRTMAMEMGLQNMGGPVRPVLDSLPTPTVTYGAVMSHDDRTGKMVGMKYGEMLGGHGGMSGMGGMGGGSDSSRAGGMAGMEHAGHAEKGGTRDSAGGDVAGQGHDAMAGMSDSMSMRDLMQLQMRMMSDPVIRERVMADTGLRRMMTRTLGQGEAMMQGDSAGHDAHGAVGATPAAPAARPRTTPARRTSGTPTRSSGAARTADPHAGHGGTTPATKPPATRPAATPKQQPPAKKDSMPAMDHSKMPGMGTPKKP